MLGESILELRYEIGTPTFSKSPFSAFFQDSGFIQQKVYNLTTNSYSQTTTLLRQKGCTLDFAMAIGGILEFAVPLLLKSCIPYY